MTTIASLAAEFNAQPHEVAAFADLGTTPQDSPLSPDTEEMIREAWPAAASDARDYDVTGQNRAEELLMDEVADVLYGAGYED